MKNRIKRSLFKNFSNILGWQTNRKIVVFESDDWGSIRMPSRSIFDRLAMQGLDLSSGDAKRYNLYDTLASSDDLSSLFETLSSVKDKNNNFCVVTAVNVVANPCFEKIKKANYLRYYYEPFTVTLKRNKYSEKSFKLWKEGFQNGLFIPQFHGREHLNVQLWLKALQKGDKETILAFEHGIWGFKNKNPRNISYQAAFELDDVRDLEYQHEIISSGLKLFEQIHGYKARFFVPPNGPFNNQLEKTAYQNGVLYMSASKIQSESIGFGKTRIKFHYLGQKNKSGQRYITRNCFFEPSKEGKDWVNSCLFDISNAFRWKKPAIISSHRVNYIGGIQPANRDRGLKQLATLLKSITNKWPEAEFMSSNELGDLITDRDR